MKLLKSFICLFYACSFINLAKAYDDCSGYKIDLQGNKIDPLEILFMLKDEKYCFVGHLKEAQNNCHACKGQLYISKFSKAEHVESKMLLEHGSWGKFSERVRVRTANSKIEVFIKHGETHQGVCSEKLEFLELDLKHSRFNVTLDLSVEELCENNSGLKYQFKKGNKKSFDLFITEKLGPKVGIQGLVTTKHYVYERNKYILKKIVSEKKTDSFKVQIRGESYKSYRNKNGVVLKNENHTYLVNKDCLVYKDKVLFGVLGVYITGGAELQIKGKDSIDLKGDWGALSGCGAYTKDHEEALKKIKG